MFAVEMGRSSSTLCLEKDTCSLQASSYSPVEVWVHLQPYSMYCMQTASPCKPPRQPTFNRLGVKYDSRTAQGLLRGDPGLAGQLLYSVHQALSGMATNAKVRRSV